jgi:hypothetical protein
MQAAPVTHVRGRGPGAAVVAARLWLVFLVGIGFVQLYFALRARAYLDPHSAFGLPIFRTMLIFVALRVFAAGLGLYLLTVGRGRAALFGAMAAMLFFVPVGDLAMRLAFEIVAGMPLYLRLIPLPGGISLVITVGLIAWLLLSKRANARFGIGLHDRLIQSAPRVWVKLRGRHLFQTDIQDFTTR